ncbi:MAG TPA: serine/threonine-protein kinase [Planctomycetota bacterium]|nr:serine/threonine-protein kinase [Planctomycetota bacterium]
MSSPQLPADPLSAQNAQTVSMDGSAPHSSGAEAPVLPAILRVGEYDLIREIARGGMGVVYEARHTQLQRTVAMKMILSGQFAGSNQLIRFRTEAEAAANLDHPHIVPIYEIGSYEGKPFFTMKLLSGGSVAQKIGEYSKDPRRTAALMLKVSRAVHFAHQRGILHRDLKPENILLDDSGEPAVADFGLAKRVDESPAEPGTGPSQGVTQSGSVIGTPAYMAPEQAAGNNKRITVAADVYSLGAILYELLTGRPPFSGKSLLDLLMKVQTEPPEPPRKVNPKADTGLELICLKCLEKDPAQRYVSAEALAQDLERWLNGEPLSVNPANVLFRLVHWTRTHIRAAVWAASIGAVIAFALNTLIGSIVLRSDALRSITQAYEKFPSVKQPPRLDWLVPGEPSPGIILLLLLLSLSLMISWGLLLTWTTRPKNRWDDLITGLGSGITAAVLLFIFSSGWAMPIGFKFLPVHEDLLLLAGKNVEDITLIGDEPPPKKDDGKPKLSAEEKLLKRYPDLAGVPAAERSGILMPKVVADLQFQMPMMFGVWLYILTTACLGTAVSQSMAAGSLLRRGDSILNVVLPYLELSFAWFILILTVNGWLQRLIMPAYVREPMGWNHGPLSDDLLETMLTALPVAVAIAGTAWSWTARRRLLGYATCATLIAGITSGFAAGVAVALPLPVFALPEMEVYRRQTFLRKGVILILWLPVWLIILGLLGHK